MCLCMSKPVNYVYKSVNTLIVVYRMTYLSLKNKVWLVQYLRDLFHFLSIHYLK